MLIQITVCNRGPGGADLHLLPTLWFRNRWSWQSGDGRSRKLPGSGRRLQRRRAVDPRLGERYLYCENDAPLLFTENETNTQRILAPPNRTPLRKRRHQQLRREWATDAVNPEKNGTKAAAHYRVTVEPAQARVVRLWLSDVKPRPLPRPTEGVHDHFGAHFDESCRARQTEADEFYATVIPASSTPTRTTSCVKPWPACCGASSSITTTSTNGWKNAAPIHSRRPQDGPPQRPMAPHVQRRHHLDAGQVGISLVCRLGSRLPRPRA